MNEPVYPWMEVFVRPYLGDNPNEPIVTLSRDAAGVWWHTVGNEPVRPATQSEALLMLAPKVWCGLGTPARS